MYWLFRTVPTKDDDVQIYEQPKTISTYHLDFGLGVEQPKDNIPIIELTIKEDQKGQMTDNLIAPGTTGLVFNKKILSLLEKLEVANVDYYETKITTYNGEVFNNYKTANVIGNIECVDYEKSELVLWDDTKKIKFIDRLILKEDVLKDTELLIFRLADYTPLILVHDQIKIHFEHSDITGVEFYKPEDFIL